MYYIVVRDTVTKGITNVNREKQTIDTNWRILIDLLYNFLDNDGALSKDFFKLVATPTS